jgi:hypothetical protein
MSDDVRVSASVDAGQGGLVGAGLPALRVLRSGWESQRGQGRAYRRDASPNQRGPRLACGRGLARATGVVQRLGEPARPRPRLQASRITQPARAKAGLWVRAKAGLWARAKAGLWARACPRYGCCAAAGRASAAKAAPTGVTKRYLRRRVGNRPGAGVKCWRGEAETTQ